MDSSGRVLVVDSWNNRVILLNKDLQLERILVDHLDNNPYRLCYVEKAGQLFIGESVENVKVYMVNVKVYTFNVKVYTYTGQRQGVHGQLPAFAAEPHQTRQTLKAKLR